MAERNAHDDERDTANLAAGDTADLAAGDATDLAVDDTSDSAVDDTSDLAAGDAADLAIDDATDLAAADTARPQTPAEQLTPAGRAVSPSPSPTPAFAATDRPARRARRLRWKPGVTRPMMALSAASFALMIAGVGGYVSAIPAVVAGDKPSAVVIPLESALWLDGQMREVQAGPVSSTRAVGPLTVEGSKTDAAAPDAAAALGIGSSSGMLGVASLTGASRLPPWIRRSPVLSRSLAPRLHRGLIPCRAPRLPAARRRRAQGLREAVPRPAPVPVRVTPAVRAARRATRAVRARVRKAPAAPTPVPLPHLPAPRPSRRRRLMPC